MKHCCFQLSRGVFFITLCGLIGWCYETILTSILWERFCGFFARGFLHVPVCPIYGFFALMLLAIFQIPFLRRLRSWKYAAAVFLIGTTVSTVLELISSYLLEWILGVSLWSYADWWLNFEGRISLFSSLLFGGLALALFFGVLPLFFWMEKKLSLEWRFMIGFSCGAVLIIDLILTLI